MISVILATHNGERTLERTLDALRSLHIPGEGAEFIAVNNASTDRTKQILQEFCKGLPLRVLDEPRPGKSFALNLGIRHANGDILLFTDDDVIPSSHWLLAFSEAAAAKPQISLFAGQVRHSWEKDPPRWLARLAEEGRSFAGTPASLEPGPVSAAYVKGCNFMVRSHVCEDIRFSEDGGINFTGQATSQGGEDTDFVKRCLEVGYTTWYVPTAVNRHIVRQEQIGLVPVVRRYFRIGRAGARQGPGATKPRPVMLFGYPRYLYRVIPVEVGLAAIDWFGGRKYKAAHRLVDVAMSCGRAHQNKLMQQRSHAVE